MNIFDKLPNDVFLRATKLNARLIAAELHDLGINVDCAPVLDVPIKGAHDIIGDRALSHDPARVAAIGRAVCDGLLEGGILPVIKHIPGHGRAFADSHLELPQVDANQDELIKSDFLPFRELADQPLAMTAHVVYTALDAKHPATTSPRVIFEFLRGEIGFDGLLMSDDLSMKALSGNMEERTKASLAAGCDIVLHCNGEMREMQAVTQSARPLDAEGIRRWSKAASLLHPPLPFDFSAAKTELASLLA
jgi:beta-N-acetylhexosaminidase